MAIITLTTDFGVEDCYVGMMKGVILSICREARIVDLTHSVEPYAIKHGAYALLESWRWFAEGATHVVVVDPGVGSERRALVARAAGRCFVGPDNGVLSWALEDAGDAEVRVLDVDRFALPDRSHTFHGRDVFAPAAAWLSGGKPFADFGERVDDWLRLPLHAPAEVAPGRLQGSVLHVDRFGNVVTSFPGHLLVDGFRLTLGGREVIQSAPSYASGPVAELFALVGSGGRVEVSLREASAAAESGLVAGDSVQLSIPTAVEE